MAVNSHSIDLEASSSQSLSRTNDFDFTTGSVEMWTKLETSGVNQYLAANYANSGAAGFSFRISSGDKLQLWFGAGSNTATGSTSLTTGVWYHVAATWDTSEKIVYLNGVQDGIDTVDETLTAGGATLYIGRNSVSADGYFDGTVDDVRIWNTKRTPTELLNNKNYELVGNESGLQAYWKLNNDLEDSTSNNRDLTNNGSAVFAASPTVGFFGFLQATGFSAGTVGFGTPVLASIIGATGFSAGTVGFGTPGFIGTDWSATPKSSTSWTNVSKS